MTTPIQFHLDEHVPSAVAVGLRAYGIDVTTTGDAGLSGAADPEHIAFALREGRVIFTHDDDFLRHAAAGEEHAGIAFCHQNKYPPG